jgi:hypothetical protein
MVEQQWAEQWVAEVATTDTWAQVVARAWADAAFEARLVADPRAVLGEAGLAVPAELVVRVQAAPGVLEAPRSGACFVLPPKPLAGELMEEQLAAQAGTIRVSGCSKQCATYPNTLQATNP